MSHPQRPNGNPADQHPSDQFPIYDPAGQTPTSYSDPVPGGPVAAGTGHGIDRGKPRRTNRGWIPAVVVVGALALASMYFAPGAGIDGNRTTPVSGTFTAAQLDVENGAVNVRYADIPQALIKEERRRKSSRLTQRIDGSTLRVRIDDRRWFSFGQAPEVTLLLPQSMEASAPGLDVRSDAGRVEVAGNYGSAKLDSSAGAVVANGSFRDLDAHSSAGEVRLDVTAATVKADSSAGRVDLQLRDTKTVRAKSSAGAARISMTGVQPDSVDARSSAGRVDLDLPDGSYRIQADSSAGRASIESVVNDPNSPHTVEAHSSAGGVRVY